MTITQKGYSHDIVDCSNRLRGCGMATLMKTKLRSKQENED